jgi:hypothetical protein
VTQKPKVSLVARHHTQPPLSALDPETPKKLERRWGPNIIANTERQMKAILAAAGMPTDAGIFFETSQGDRICHYRGLDKLAVSRGHQVDSEVWYAAKILEQIADWRGAMNGGNVDQITHEALHLGVLLREADIRFVHGGTIDRGERFEDGPKEPRRDLLTRLIDESLARLGKNATAKKIWEDIEGRPGIQEATDQIIHWRNRQGSEKTTTFKAFQNRVSERRKIFHNYSGKR